MYPEAWVDGLQLHVQCFDSWVYAWIGVIELLDETVFRVPHQYREAEETIAVNRVFAMFIVVCRKNIIERSQELIHSLHVLNSDIKSPVDVQYTREDIEMLFWCRAELLALLLDYGPERNGGIGLFALCIRDEEVHVCARPGCILLNLVPELLPGEILVPFTVVLVRRKRMVSVLLNHLLLCSSVLVLALFAGHLYFFKELSAEASINLFVRFDDRAPLAALIRQVSQQQFPAKGPQPLALIWNAVTAQRPKLVNVDDFLWEKLDQIVDLAHDILRYCILVVVFQILEWKFFILLCWLIRIALAFLLFFLLLHTRPISVSFCDR